MRENWEGAARQICMVRNRCMKGHLSLRFQYLGMGKNLQGEWFLQI